MCPSYTSEREQLKGQIKTFFSDPKGQKYIDDYLTGKTKTIVIDLDELASFDKDIANTIVDNASKFGMAALESAIIEIVVNNSVGNSHIDKSRISVIGSNSIPRVLVHDIGANEKGKMVRVHGLVNRTTQIHPMYLEAVFKCVFCGAESPSIIQDNPWVLTKPFPKCEGCEERTIWEPIPDSSDMANSQEFMLQESYEDISSNKMPRPIQCITFKEHLMNYVNCGDDIEAICVVLMTSLSKKFIKTKFNTTYLEVLSVDKKRKDPESIVFSPEEEAQFQELAKDPEIYNKIIGSLAPSIYGHENEKEAIILAIFGSPEVKLEDIIIRGNMHLLMVGDPSTAKSQLLRAGVELSPRGMYAMGRGTTAAGLTAALHKSDNGDEWEISAGVLVLADEGVAAVDEIEKMREEDRVLIHEAMEQQTVSINKAGINVQLKAKTAVIAAANPTLGRYDQYKSVFENLPKFPPSLFSRFDLIFKVLDIPNEEMDEKIATHILKCPQIKSPIDRSFLKRYIAYSKKIKPTITEEVENTLVRYYVDARKSYKTDQKTFPLDARRFLTVKRLTLAHARALLKTQANMEDFKVAKRLFDVFLKDTIGGDVTSIETGQDVTQRSLQQIIIEALRSHPMTKSDLRDSVNCQDEGKFDKALMRLISDSIVYEQGRSLTNESIYAVTC